MDIISISVSKLMTRAATADATPDSTVATTGVPVNGNIWLSDLYIQYKHIRRLTRWWNDCNRLSRGDRCFVIFSRIKRKIINRLIAYIGRSLEQQTVLGHRVNDPGHWKHGTEHADQQPGHRTRSHDHLAPRRADLHKHV